ncbi:helix-turn-helix transcriptional regulator [Mucilaginibacter sp.]|uniref:helix-turn-helix domain-containing protein n=1 Tax=Mucilaginibacter sp. TaxID=1882438 RepID=UPI00262E7338|nr:helix-turn-helix transcriptional regulator [Mucilaginibacter sp.]MDB4919471.1 response regulator containing a CheY-like receiver domain and an DNA-binding domain [Mucilaginibacter sp.]
MTFNSLPAGLLDNRIEFFGILNQPDISYALTGGQVYRVKDLPAEIKISIWGDINMHPQKLEQLIILGYTTPEAILEKYCCCCFGLYDGEADYTDGTFIHAEYVHCNKRDTCPANGVLCNPLTVGKGHALTHRQASVLRLAGRCMLNKEIAGHLKISEETVKIHIKNIQQKAGLMNKKDLVLLAHQKQLI